MKYDLKTYKIDIGIRDMFTYFSQKQYVLKSGVHGDVKKIKKALE